MKKLFVPVIAGLKKLLLCGTVTAFASSAAAQAMPSMDTYTTTATVHSRCELMDNSGDIWYAGNLPEEMEIGDTVIVTYLVNNPENPYDDEIVRIYHGGRYVK